MKTELNGADLMIIHDLLVSQLRIANRTQEYKDQCIIVANKISKALSEIMFEVKG